MLTLERQFISGLLLEFQKFWDRPSTGPFVLVHHGDPDGCCAAALTLHWAEKTARSLPDQVLWVSTAEFDFKALLQRLTAIEAKKIIFLDVNIANTPSALARLLVPADRFVAIYDDHIPESLPQAGNLLYLNPYYIGNPPREIPPCLFGGFLLESAGYRMDWVVGTGLMGESLAQKYKDYFDIKSPGEICEMKTVVERLSSYYLYEQNKEINVGLSLVLGAMKGGGAREFLQGGGAGSIDLSVVAKIVADRVNQFANSEDSLVAVGEISGYPCRVYEIDNPFFLANLVASRKRWVFRDSIIFVLQPLSDRVVLEARRSPELSAVDLSKLLQSVTQGMEVLNVGGHPPAAGAAVELNARQQLIKVLTNS